MKNYVINRLNESKITDETFRNRIFDLCQIAVNNILDKEIEYWNFIHDGKNIHRELWSYDERNNSFKLQIEKEDYDWGIMATITQDRTGLYTCQYYEYCLGADRNNIINELYNRAYYNRPVKEELDSNNDYKILMAQLYYKIKQRIEL